MASQSHVYLNVQRIEANYVIGRTLLFCCGVSNTVDGCGMLFEQKYCSNCCCVGVYFFDLWIFTLQKDFMEPNSSKHGRRHRVGVTYNVSLWGGWPSRGFCLSQGCTSDVQMLIITHEEQLTPWIIQLDWCYAVYLRQCFPDALSCNFMRRHF